MISRLLLTRKDNKGKPSRDSGGAQGSQSGKGKGSREQHSFLERKADQAFQEESAAQRKLSEAQSALDRREWKMQDADGALYVTGIQLSNPRGWNFIKRIN